MRKPRPIELLAPAKNAEVGREAIIHGADAVYIGAPQFSARAAAGNSLEEIAGLIRFAHQYDARIYVALNTILTDTQLPQAERLIHQLYEIGADALIIQDLGILELEIPPIPLHASTQMDNRTPEKVEFLDQMGFEQVVLARELSLRQIKAIASRCDVPLEVFIHGALCVSYSGQCYLSEAVAQRSANRGACAQLCRLPYDLIDGGGRTIQRQKHLLSLKDLNQSDYIARLLEAGVSSFKIEGRLKDVGYVKNATAYYRQSLDSLIAEHPDRYRRASAGRTSVGFVPNLAEGFNRGASNYFIADRTRGMTQPLTPKAMGYEVATVVRQQDNWVEVNASMRLNNGDGLSYINRQGELVGFRVNRAEGNRIYPLGKQRLERGTVLRRNLNQAWEERLAAKSAERTIGLDVRLEGDAHGITLTLTDERGIMATHRQPHSFEPARAPQREQLIRTLRKLGDTIFRLEHFEIHMDHEYFIPASVLTQMRREAVALLNEAHDKKPRRMARKAPDPAAHYPQNELSYLGNVANEKARTLLMRHGVEHIEPAYELRAVRGARLMHTKFCLLYELRKCKRLVKPHERLAEPLLLRNDRMTLRLAFDCAACEMAIYLDGE